MSRFFHGEYSLSIIYQVLLLLQKIPAVLCDPHPLHTVYIYIHTVGVTYIYICHPTKKGQAILPTPRLPGMIGSTFCVWTITYCCTYLLLLLYDDNVKIQASQGALPPVFFLPNSVFLVASAGRLIICNVPLGHRCLHVYIYIYMSVHTYSSKQ